MILAHWDDDDWYSPARVESQITPLIEGAADITALECSYVYRVADGGCWTISPELHRRMFIGDVHGGTLVYRRAVWDAGIRYPAVDLAEDAVFLRRALAAGRRLAKLPSDGAVGERMSGRP